MYEHFNQVADDLEELNVKQVTPEQLRKIQEMYVVESFKYELDNFGLDS